MTKLFYYFFISLPISNFVFSQSPELSLREFASGQIKKGVRSIGMGGDGATWGNYSLVWKDSSTALIDGGVTNYTNNNNFSFTAVGITTPSIWHGLTIYAIELSQYASNISTSLKSPVFGSNAASVLGDANNQALFLKAALPIDNHFSVGILISYERSQFNAVSDSNPTNYVRYQTNWLPSGGFGISYQPNKRLLVGFRALINQDMENRIDNVSTSKGLNSTQEYRLGASIGLWKGALVDVGGNLRHRHNAISNTDLSRTEPNIGFEQNLFQKHLALRVGLDETSKTCGFSLKYQSITFDFAYLNNIGFERVGNIFGTNSNSFISTLVFHYGNFKNKKHI